MLIDILDITADSSVQPRESLNNEKLTEYGNVVLNGGDLDPISLIYDGSVYWLADGFHRLDVYRMAGKTHIPAEVREGNRRDAILFGIKRNVRHGLGLSLKERKNAARRLLLDPEWSQWSGREIGRICGLDNKTVECIKTKLLESLAEENPQLQNFTNTSASAVSNSKAEILQHLSCENCKTLNSSNAPVADFDSLQPQISRCASEEFPQMFRIQNPLRKIIRGGKEYTLNTANIGRNGHRQNTDRPKDATVDISATTQTVYEFLPSSDSSANEFRIFEADYEIPIAVDNKLELTLTLISGGPSHAMPLIVQQMIAFPGFAQFILHQAQQLADRPPALRTVDHPL